MLCLILFKSSLSPLFVFKKDENVAYIAYLLFESREYLYTYL